MPDAIPAGDPRSFRFWLGCPEPAWLWNAPPRKSVSVPSFVSLSRLERYKVLRPARVPVAVDSGGFWEVTHHGGWRTSAKNHVQRARRAVAGLRTVEWVAQQDWMCEEAALRATGLTVLEHQRRTVENFVELLELAPDVPWVPVLQGRSLESYLEHASEFAAAGVDLTASPVVGVGSVCRRQRTGEIVRLLEGLARLGLRLHGFGVKATGLRQAGHLLASADSMAWSQDGRRLGGNKANDPAHGELFADKMTRLAALAGDCSQLDLLTWRRL